MANTMFNGMNLNNTKSLIQQFNNFKSQIQQSGKDPKKMLDELVASGKYSQTDIDKARMMANAFAKLL